jgi:hypothetical protein
MIAASTLVAAEAGIIMEAAQKFVATASAIADSIRWAEKKIETIDECWPWKNTMKWSQSGRGSIE